MTAASRETPAKALKSGACSRDHPCQLTRYRVAPESSPLMIQDAVLLHMVTTVHCSRLSRADLDEDELNGAEYHDPGGEAEGNLAISSGVLGAGVTPEPVQTSPSCHTAPPEGVQSQLSESALL